MKAATSPVDPPDDDPLAGLKELARQAERQMDVQLAALQRHDEKVASLLGFAAGGVAAAATVSSFLLDNLSRHLDRGHAAVFIALVAGSVVAAAAALWTLAASYVGSLRSNFLGAAPGKAEDAKENAEGPGEGEETKRVEPPTQVRFFTSVGHETLKEAKDGGWTLAHILEETIDTYTDLVPANHEVLLKGRTARARGTWLLLGSSILLALAYLYALAAALA
jgi:hypothetical protein